MIKSRYSIYEKGGHFPSKSHELLLKAALFPRDEALTFFRKWLVKVNLENLNPEDTDFLSRFLDPLDPACHRLLPLLVDNLGIWNHSYLQKLKGHQKNVWVKNQRIFLSVKELIEAFNQYKIEHIIIKGISLASQYYERIEHRPMNDGDILIPFHEKKRVLELISESKLGVEFNDWEKDMLDFVHATHLVGQGRMDIDLHWSIFNEYSQMSESSDFAWAKAKTHNWGKSKTKILDPAHELFVALVHGRHFDPVPPIRWVADCLMILRNKNVKIDWDDFLRLSKEFCYLPFIKVAVPYLKDHFNANIPSYVLTEIDNLKASDDEISYYESISSNIRSGGFLGLFSRGTKRRMVYYRLFLKERWTSVWHYLFSWYIHRLKREYKK